MTSDTSSTGDSIRSFHEPGITEAESVDLIRTITENRNDVLSRLEELSRELSLRTVRDGPIQIDPHDFDLRDILKSYVRQQDGLGIKMRDVGVTLEDVSVYGVDQSFAFLPTMSNVLRGPYGAIKEAKENKGRKPKAILQNMFGLANSGEMVLVLGRPGAGCSSLLKTITGTDLQLFTSVEGEIDYNGIPQKDMLKSFRSDLVYNPELDVHFPHLTVEQTLKFAIGCKTPRTRANGISKEEYVNFNKEMLATVFGLRHTYHSKVGNDFIRGVSGGERKRVSIAEAMSCNGSVYCWDNATRGLDASTALEYAKAIRTSTNLLKSTAFVTLYQAGENIYETFDKVTVLYKGRQIYFGPVMEAKAYFEEMGYECPPRQTTAEFLTAVTDPLGRFPKPGYEKRVPNTADEFVAYWVKSTQFAALKDEIAGYKSSISKEKSKAYLHESMLQEKQKYQRAGSQYTVNYYEQFRLCLVRAFQNIWGDKAYTIIQIVAALSQSLIVGSLYYNTPETVSGAFSRGGVIFFSVLYLSLSGLAEVSNSFSARPILMKQRNYSLYHPSAFAIAESVSFFPVSVCITLLFSLVLYFLANLAREAGKFFTFFLFSLLVGLCMSSLFKAVAAWNKTISAANSFAGVLVLASLMYSSYMIQRPSMHPWFKWISYINPILYGFEAMITTEFHGRHMSCDSAYLTPHGAGYSASNTVCSFTGSVSGQDWVDGDRYVSLAFSYSFKHVWRNFGILIALLIFFIFLTALGFEVVRPITGGGDRLFFLRGKVPANIVLPHQAESTDEESGPSVAHELEKVSSGDTAAKTEAFDDLRSKDIFVWKDVDYVIPYDGGERKLLDSVSGFCAPGKLTALMGESGAGKTTLLNALSQRTDIGVVTGDILVNGGRLDASFKRRTGYVQQQDIHLAQSTVRESLRFAARLRRPQSVPDSEKLEYVEKIIKVLDMTDYADAIVGTPGSGLNVEERKKLTIGVELVAKPSLLLFLDEPTSGLDSQSAWAIVKLLRELANAGQSILCTIHQPSATLFEEFDRLLLLRKGGQTVYFGDIGDRSRVILEYFELNGARKCSPKENPAEYILEAIGAGATAHTDHDWFEVWSGSDERKKVDISILKLTQEGVNLKQSVSLSAEELKEFENIYATSAQYQFRWVLIRNYQTFWRTPDYVMSKIMLMTISGLFIGFTFFGLKHTLTGMQNGMFCAFLSVVVSAPIINQIQAQCMVGRDVYEGRERLSNTYRWWLLLVVQFLTEIPYLFVGGAIMFVSLYFPTQANTLGPHAGIFYFTNGIFLQLFNITFAIMLLYGAPDVQSAAVFVSFLYSFIVGFAGVTQPVRLMPGFWTFMNKVSPYTYIIQNLVSSFLHERKVTCSSEELSYLSPPSGETCQQYLGKFVDSNGGYLTNPSATDTCGYCRYAVGDQYLLTIDAKYSYIWRNVGFFCVYVIFNLLAGLVIYKLARLTKYKGRTAKKKL